MMKCAMTLAAAATLVSLAAHTSSAADTLVYANIFETPLGPEWTGAGALESVQGYSFAGNGANVFTGTFLRNDSVLIPGSPIPDAQSSTLTLTGLGAHTAVRLEFLLAIIDSWDGINGSPGPDRFGIRIDGVTVFIHIFAIQSGGSSYTPPPNGQIFSGAAGFSNFNDLGFDMSLEPTLNNIPHSASTMTIEFFASGPGWQGSTDESWAIDNLRVYTIVPTPGAMGLLGLGALVAGRRKR
ncbi:hypothetical protein BH11PLA1_BH11PLA1_02640 [soil metagenome]